MATYPDNLDHHPTHDPDPPTVVDDAAGHGRGRSREIILLVRSGVWLMTGRNEASQPLTEVAPYDAPDFTLRNLDGETVSLSDYRGKVVLLNFWGTWCPPCREETPALQAAYQRYQDQGFVVVGVDLLFQERSQYQRDVDDVRTFAKLYGVTYPMVLDEDGSASQAYGIAPLPTSYIIDRDGKVRYIQVGPLDTAYIAQVLQELQDDPS
jgi:cytochrome c biogenesis protein CcmG, thiol:disulfide interchange protein DsbE